MMADPKAVRVDVRLKSAIESGGLPRQLLVSGPAGTGKTLGILRLLHILASDFKDLRILIARQTRVSLTESVLVTFEQEVIPSDGMESLAYGASRRNRKSYDYPLGSTIVLGGLDRPDRILSTAWDVVYVNEAIEVAEAYWDTICSRMRRPGRPAWLGYMIGDTNPGDPTHWLKARCDEGQVTLWETDHRANPALHDGRDWTEAGRHYMESLRMLRGTRRKRLLDGLWAAGEGVWFESFDPSTQITDEAEYDPRWPVHLAVDTGVHTGAVWFQVRGEGEAAHVTVFGDYYAYDRPAIDKAGEILARGRRRTEGRMSGSRDHFDVGRMDPAGNSRTGTGVVESAEYERGGLRLRPWPKGVGCIGNRLGLVESFVSVDPAALSIHPRCKHLIAAFANYRRKKRGGQWIDEPEDPQHPHEELMDALGSGLLDKFPDGRKLPFKGGRRTAASVTH